MDLQKMKYKLYESHVVYKACALYKKFKGKIRYNDLINQNFADLVCISPFNNKEYVANSLEYFTKVALIKEMLSLLGEAYLKQNIDFDDPEVRSLLLKLREKLPDKLKSLDNFQTIKMIRDSFVHNSEEIHNFKYEFGNLFKIKLRHKLLGDEKYYIDLSVNDLVTIVYIYDENRIVDAGNFGYINFKGEQQPSIQTLLESHKKFGSFNNLMSIVDKNGNEIELDRFQNKALFRYLIQNKKEIAELSNKFGYDPSYFLIRFGPFKDNSVNNYEYKINFSDNLTLMSLDRNMTADGLADLLKKEYKPRYIQLRNSKLYDSTLYSTLAFSIFTGFSRDDLKSIVDNGNYEYSAEELAHLRNAFVHGRYYYNYDDGFETYDGTKELSHVKTLTFDMIVDLLKTINDEIKNDGPVSIDFSLIRG